MKFILKDGLIHIVDNHGIANNNIEGIVEAAGLEGYSLEYSVNNKEYKPVRERLTLTKEELKATQINIVVRAIKGRDILYFKSDTIPLTHAIIFGKNLEDSYPEALKYLLKRMDYIEKVIGIKEKEIDENMKQTKEILQKDFNETKLSIKETMVELVDTFEEITRKGSLF